MRISLIRQEGNYSLRLPEYYDTRLLNPQQTENRRIDTRPVLFTNIPPDAHHIQRNKNSNTQA